MNLQGKYFTAHVQNGDVIKKGDLLISFEKEAIQKEGYEIITPVLVTNIADFTSLQTEKQGDVKAGENFLSIH